MNVLEKILEEIDDEIKECGYAPDSYYAIGLKKAMNIIHKHMNEVEDMHGKRLIDANALDDEVINFFLAITGNTKQTTVVRECKESFRKMIDEQPTIYANDDWIPVEERLPDIRADGYENVIITDKNGFVYPNVVYGYVEEDDKEPRFHEWDDEYWQCTSYDAIAWRPLPEAYKLEGAN